jgi:hypothetical protein
MRRLSTHTHRMVAPSSVALRSPGHSTADEMTASRCLPDSHHDGVLSDKQIAHSSAHATPFSV